MARTASEGHEERAQGHAYYQDGNLSRSWSQQVRARQASQDNALRIADTDTIVNYGTHAAE